MKTLNYILILILFVSCTKEIKLNLSTDETQFVVYGHIEKGETAKICLTLSAPYFNPISWETFENSLVNNATVIITNSLGENEILTPGFGLTDTWYYNYFGSTMLGEEGVTYNLQIISDDISIISATTKIPTLAPMNPDSLRFIYRADDSTYCYLLGHWTDPDTIGNCIRAFSQTKSIWGCSFDEFPPNDGFDDFFIPMLEQDGNYNDEYVNGWSFSFPMYKGRGYWQEWGIQQCDSLYEEEEEEIDGVSGATTGFWSVGDSVRIKWSSVDRVSWDFWASLQYNNPGGPFGSPSEANSNINGGLGVFGGASSEYFDRIAQPE